MAKSLGQIHTTSATYTFAAAGERNLHDTQAILCDQLQHMVRQGQYYKIVGIDMSLADIGDPQSGGAAVSGRIRYYAPTRGRCEAYKGAFRAVMSAMKDQGINVRGNNQYDFRVPLSALTSFQNGTDFVNAASISGTGAATLTLDNSAATAAHRVFDVYNAGVLPQQTATPDFPSGYGIYGSTSDFVVAEGNLWNGSEHPLANGDLEEIPFQLNYDSTGDPNSVTATFMWRPDPALYLAVLTGQFDIIVDNLETHGDWTNVDIRLSVHVAGWKSIMGNPDKKRRKGTRHKKSAPKKSGGKK